MKMNILAYYPANSQSLFLKYVVDKVKKLTLQICTLYNKIKYDSFGVAAWIPVDLNDFMKTT